MGMSLLVLVHLLLRLLCRLRAYWVDNGQEEHSCIPSLRPLIFTDPIPRHAGVVLETSPCNSAPCYFWGPNSDEYAKACVALCLHQANLLQRWIRLRIHAYISVETQFEDLFLLIHIVRKGHLCLHDRLRSTRSMKYLIARPL
jgi:hypothetical protein